MTLRNLGTRLAVAVVFAALLTMPAAAFSFDDFGSWMNGFGTNQSANSNIQQSIEGWSSGFAQPSQTANNNIAQNARSFPDTSLPSPSAHSRNDGNNTKDRGTVFSSGWSRQQANANIQQDVVTNGIATGWNAPFIDQNADTNIQQHTEVTPHRTNSTGFASFPTQNPRNDVDQDGYVFVFAPGNTGTINVHNQQDATSNIQQSQNVKAPVTNAEHNRTAEKRTNSTGQERSNSTQTTTADTTE